MISFAKKILAPGRTTTTQPLGSDAKVRKYSLASAHEQPVPVSGTSFTLNPEHLFSSPHPFGRGGITSGHDGFTPNRIVGNIMVNAPNVDASGGSNHVENLNELSSRVGSPREGERDGSIENLTSVIATTGAMATSAIATSPIASRTITTGVIVTTSITASEHQCRDGESHIQSAASRANTPHSSDENTSEPQADNETSRGSSISDDLLDSNATLSDAPANSTSSLNIPEASMRFQRARRKQQESKPRRQTLDVFYGGESFDQNSWSHSKSLTPSPDPGRVDLRSGSGVRRHTVGGLIDGLDVVTNPVNEVLGYRSGPWSGAYASSGDLVSDVLKVDHRRKAVSAEGVRRAMGLRQRSLYATAFCVSEMKKCLVIADLDLLEEDTEFEPCAVPFENAVVLWPAAADKPSCFESSGFFRSCITSLEAIGFVGSECLLVAPVTLSQGLHEHTLLLFLFPHHLLFAKQKSHSLLKLDQKVAASDIWLSTRKEDITEVLDTDSTLDGSRSFILGWPTTTNSVVTFCTSEEKAVWIAKIEELIEAEIARDKDPDRLLMIKVVHKERGHTRTRELSVSKSEKSSQVLQRCLLDFHLEASSSKDFQLYVRWGKDQPLQPILGHESPFLFETSFQTLAQRKDNSHGCCFVLRERKRTKLGPRDTVGRRRTAKVPLRMFKRSQSRTNKSSPPLFGSSLEEICVDNAIPGHIQTLLRYLYEHGPGTDGVFRKPGGYKEVSDFKLHVSSTEEVNFNDVSVHVVAAVVKEWLRRLPDCLLSSELFLQWMEVSKISDPDLLHKELRRLSSSLPSSHLLVLRHLMCVLNRIQLHSKQNRMTPFNLAVCIGPNILRPPSTAALDLQLTSVAIANAVVGMMIDAIEPVLGSDCIDLYWDVADPRVIQEFDVDGGYEQNLSLDRSFAPDSTAQSMESLDSLHDTPPITESSQTLERMSQDSGLATSTLQLSEEDPSTSAPHYLKRARQSRERSEVSETQTAFDSDTGSLSSEKSESAPVQLRMRGARNVRERVDRLRAMKMSMEELASSFDEQYLFSDDRSDSVVIAGEDRKSEDEVSTLSAGNEGTKVVGEDDRESKVMLSSADEKKDDAKLSSADEKKDDAKFETWDTPPEETFRNVNSIKIILPETASTKEEVTPQSVLIVREIPTSHVAKNWVEKADGRPLVNNSPGKQPPSLTVKSENSGGNIVSSSAEEIIARKPQMKMQRSGNVSVNVPLKVSLENRECKKPVLNSSQEDRRKDSAYELNATSKRIDHADSGAASQEIDRSRANARESRDHSLSLGSMTASKESDWSRTIARESRDHVVSLGSMTASKEIDQSKANVRESRDHALPSESMTASKEIDQSKANVRELRDHALSLGSMTASKKIDRSRANGHESRDHALSSESATMSQEINLLIDLPRSTGFVGVLSSPRDKITNGEQREVGILGPGLVDPRIKGFDVCVEEGLITARSNDRRRDHGSRDVYGKGCLNSQGRDEEPRLKDQPWDLHVKVKIPEFRLKDQPWDDRVKDQPMDSRLKDQPTDSRLKYQPRNNKLKDPPRNSRPKDQPWDNQLKDQPRYERLKDRPRNSRLKDQPRDSRLKVQPRDIDDNWRLANRIPVYSEHVERGSSTRVVTSAYVQHITSEGCRATIGAPTGHLPRYLPQNGEPPRNREPIHCTDRYDPPRSVTVIQLCDENSVIVQKSVQMT